MARPSKLTRLSRGDRTVSRIALGSIVGAWTHHGIASNNFPDRPRALCLLRSGAQVRKKSGNQIGQDDAGHPAATKRHARNIFITNFGEVADYVASIRAENEPRITFVGNSVFKLDIDTLQFQGLPDVIKHCQFNERPVRGRTTPLSQAGVPTH
jgi:hypothetical protein